MAATEIQDSFRTLRGVVQSLTKTVSVDFSQMDAFPGVVPAALYREIVMLAILPGLKVVEIAVYERTTNIAR
jgi:hypothetical protein